MNDFARVVEPELLDVLAANDPRARRSRSDLVRINFVMRQQAIMAGALRALNVTPRRLGDLGSGDGRFLLGVARRMATHWPAVTVFLVDQQNIVSDATRQGFDALGWKCECIAADVFDTLAHLDVDIMTTNLFLHHFDDGALTRLLALASEKARAFVACEPRRAHSALLASRLVFALACNHVTRHDAVASVRAGFTDFELSRLWPRAGWTLLEGLALPFTHRFAAQRDGN